MTDDTHAPPAIHGSETQAAPDHAEPPGTVADGVPRQLDPRFVAAEKISWHIFLGVIIGLSLPGLLVAWFFLLEWVVAALLLVWLVCVAGLIWLSRVMPQLTFDTTRYIVRDEGMEIRQGVYWKHIINVPRSRVQHTDVSQGPIMRRFGIATLTVHTAGTEHASVPLSGLEHETALRIRDFLLRGEAGDAV